MRTAKYQAYRNLHRPGFFSIKYKDLVIDYSEALIMKDCTFYVNENGRVKTVERRRKGVHAWVSAVSYENIKEKNISELLSEYEYVWFNPYFTKFFTGEKTGKEYKTADEVIMINNRCYVKTSK